MRWMLCALLGGGLCLSCLDEVVDPRPPEPDPQADGGTFDPDLIGAAGGGSGYGSGGAAGGGGQRPPPMLDAAVDAAMDGAVGDAMVDAESDAADLGVDAE